MTKTPLLLFQFLQPIVKYRNFDSINLFLNKRRLLLESPSNNLFMYLFTFSRSASLSAFITAAAAIASIFNITNFFANNPNNITANKASKNYRRNHSINLQSKDCPPDKQERQLPMQQQAACRINQLSISRSLFLF